MRLKYRDSRWPEQRLPKDREPGGGNVGWFELGNWHTYQWRVADTETQTEGDRLVFTFRAFNAKENPKFEDYVPRAFVTRSACAADGPPPSTRDRNDRALSIR